MKVLKNRLKQTIFYILMVNYKHGKIYKLVNDELNLTYYGSTCNELRKRLNDHKTKAKNKKCTSHKLFESGKCKIYLVEKVSCEDKMELTKRERFYIENNECINKNIPGRIDKEYHQDNKDKISEQQKEYYQNNKDKKKDYYEDNKDKLSEYNKKYRERNKEIILKQQKEYREQNKEHIKQRKKEYYQKNKEKIAQKYLNSSFNE